MKAYPDFFPRNTWGSLIGDKNRYIRNEWDNKLCNDLVGSSKGERCKGYFLCHICFVNKIKHNSEVT